jgi:hypothetical protein
MIAPTPRPGHYLSIHAVRGRLDRRGQDGVAIPSTDFSGVKGCDGLRKSVRFDLKPEPALIEISGSPAAHLLLAARKIE